MDKNKEANLPAPAGDPVVFMPVCDVIEQPHGVKVLLDMAGVEPDKVEINIDNRVLTVSGASPFHYDGREVHYRRSFQLSDDIDSGSIAAKAKNGVLELLMPKLESAKVHKIKVIQG